MELGAHDATTRGLVGSERRESRGVCFDTLVAEEQGRIRRLAWNFGVPANELDDAVQEIFMRAYIGAQRFRGDAEPATH